MTRVISEASTSPPANASEGLMGGPDPRQEALRPYVPRLVVDWLRSAPGEAWRVVDGTLAFVDISGFTKMTERLAARARWAPRR